jgi:OFA family oxalate/formate antiporter-like MFS transporter
MRWRFVVLWLIFFCNILAGITIVSFQSPLIQELWKKIDPRLSAETSAAYGATLIAVSSLFNGVGRMFWGGLSDHIGRAWTFRIVLATQIVAFLLLSRVGNPWVFGALICYVLLCYGGGFGTMPAFVLDVFGGRLMPVAYGAILTAWSAGGVVGPLMIAVLKDHCPAKAANFAFWISAAVLTTGLVLATLWRETKSSDLP